MSPQQLRIPVEDVRLAALADVVASSSEGLPLEDFLGRVLDGALGALGAEAGSILCTGLHAVGTALAVLRGRSAEHRQALQRLHDEVRLADAVLASGEPLALPSLASDPRLHEGLRASLQATGLTAYAGVPLLTRAGVRGVLAVARAGPSFAARDLEVLATLAHQVALVVDNADLSVATDRWRAAAGALAQLGRGAAGAEGVQRILEVVTEQALAVVGGEACGVFVLDKAAGLLRLARSIGLEGRPGADEPVPIGRGLAGRAVASGGAATADSGEGVATGLEAGFPAALAVPLMVWGDPFGALALYRARPDPFPEVDARLLALVAVHAGIALENAQLHAETARKREEAEALQALARLISSTLDPDEIFRVLIEWTCQVLGVSRCGLWEARQTGEDLELRLRRSVGLNPEAWGAVHLRLGEGTSGGCMARRAPVWTADILADSAIPLSEETRRRVIAEGYRAICSAPILLPEGPFGVLSIYRDEPHAFDAREVALLSAFAAQAAIAIRNARLYQEERSRSRDLTALIQASRAVTSSLDLTQILGTIVTSTVELTGASLANLMLTDTGGPLVWQACADALQQEITQATASGPITVGKSLSEEVAASRQSLWNPDITTDPREVHGDFIARHGIRCYLGVPILAGDRVLGVLSVLGPADGSVTESRRELLESLAAQAALAIENARLYTQTREAFDELAVIHEASQAVAQSLDLQETLQRILAAAMRLTETDKGIIRLLDEEHQELTEACAVGVVGAPGSRLPLNEPSLSAACLREGGVLTAENPAEDPRCHRALQARYGNKALIVAPLRSGNRIIGVMDVGDLKRPRRFGAREIAVLERLAQQAVVAIENARLFGQVLRSKSEWENTFDSISDLVAVLDLEGRVVRANRALLSRLGLPPGQVLRRSCGDLFGDDGVAWGGCPHRRALRLGARVALEVEDEKLEGTYSVSVFPVRDADGHVMGTVHIARDITEQKTIQAKLFQSDKLASMGTLAAGVAHNINNVLAAIVARADLMLLSASEPEIRRSAEVIQQAAMDGAETVRRLQEFAKIKPRAAVLLVDVNQAARDALELTQARWRDEAQARGAPIVVATHLEATAPIEGNAAEIREVLINLILNAADAMPGGGSLRIATADRPGRPAAAPGRDGSSAGPRREPEASAAHPGTVEVRVEDTGVGMSEAVYRRIFDPFFTTKGVTGTGLGLSVSYGLVTKHRGEIAVRTREGEGTTFILTFPMARPARAAPADTGSAAQSRPGRVLLIEDETALREAMAEALVIAGHQVEAVGGGREGIERFHAGAFDVVLTDLGMPEVSGLDVARAVKAAAPSVYVILCTGWGNVPGAEEPLRERGVDALLAKPFRIAEVVKVVREGLEARAAAPTA